MCELNVLFKGVVIVTIWYVIRIFQICSNFYHKNTHKKIEPFCWKRLFSRKNASQLEVNANKFKSRIYLRWVFSKKQISVSKATSWHQNFHSVTKYFLKIKKLFELEFCSAVKIYIKRSIDLKRLQERKPTGT